MKDRTWIWWLSWPGFLVVVALMAIGLLVGCLDNDNPAEAESTLPAVEEEPLITTADYSAGDYVDIDTYTFTGTTYTVTFPQLVRPKMLKYVMLSFVSSKVNTLQFSYEHTEGYVHVPFTHTYTNQTLIWYAPRSLNFVTGDELTFTKTDGSKAQLVLGWE